MLEPYDCQLEIPLEKDKKITKTGPSCLKKKNPLSIILFPVLIYP